MGKGRVGQARIGVHRGWGRGGGGMGWGRPG